MDNEHKLLIARIEVLQNLVRILFFERARRHNQTPEEAMRLGELIKEWTETTLGMDEPTAYITAAVDNFFNTLASDLIENPRK